VDEASRNVVAFLEGVQSVREELHSVWNHYTRRGLKISNYPGCGPTWALAGYFDLGIMVIGGDGRNYDLFARLRWSSGEWVVQADISLEQETEQGDCTYPLLRELPEQRTSNWQAALDHWRAAIAALSSFEDLIPVK
jgi:hypothetical protein